MKQGFAIAETTGPSWLQGYIYTTFEELVRTFGEPLFSQSKGNATDKTTCEWQLRFDDGTQCTIYDYRERRTPKDAYEWHVGGQTARAVDLVTEHVFDSPPKMHVLTTTCKHNFHFACLTKWLSKKKACPVCRSEVLLTN